MPVDYTDYEALTVAELKEMASQLGVQIPHDARKAEIIDALKAAVAKKEKEPPAKAKVTSAEDADVLVTGAGSSCNGRYTNVNHGDHFDGPGGLAIQHVEDYPAAGDLIFAIVDQSARIHYYAPNADTLSYPWEGTWQVGSFGVAPVPQVIQAPEDELNQYQMSSTVDAVMTHDTYHNLKLTA